MGNKSEFEIFTGKGLIEDGHYDRLGTQRRDSAGKQKTLGEIKKQLTENSLSTPVKDDKRRGDSNMLVIKHQNMRNKTLVVGTTVFVFDGNSVARVPMSARADFEALMRRPGFSVPYVSSPSPAPEEAAPVKKAAPKKEEPKKAAPKKAAPVKKAAPKKVAPVKKAAPKKTSKRGSKSTPIKSAAKKE